MSWPPTLDNLKLDAGVTDDRDDAQLQVVLDAAVAFVQRVRPEFGYPDVPDVGDVVQLAALVTDADYAPINAATMFLEIELPDGTFFEGSVTNPPAETGQYRYDFLPSQAGEHVARWESTAPNTAMANTFTVNSLAGRQSPPKDLELGAIRLAIRWHARRRSPDALLSMAEFGTARIPSFDPDIERLLGIGRYRGPVFA